MKWINKLIEKQPKIFFFAFFIISFWISYFFVFISTPFGLISTDLSTVWLQWIGTFIGGAISVVRIIWW